MAGTYGNAGATAAGADSRARSGTATGATLRIILLALFVFSAFTAMVSAWQGWRSRSFVEVEGEIVGLTVNLIEGRSGGTSRSFRPPSRESRYLGVTYVYDFNGINYRGDQVRAGSFGFSNGADFAEFRPRLEVGRRVPVYLDPGDPRFAVLARGHSNMLAMFLALTGFLGIANLIAIGMRRASRPRRRRPQRSLSVSTGS